VPEDERLGTDRHLREFDRLGEDLQVIERDLARSALADDGVKRLMTIPGVDMTVALAMKAAIGDVSRFDEPQKLVSYLGLNPGVRQSGPGPAYHGRITKQGRGHTRGMLVEAAWAAARAPGPLCGLSSSGCEPGAKGKPLRPAVRDGLAELKSTLARCAGAAASCASSSPA